MPAPIQIRGPYRKSKRRRSIIDSADIPDGWVILVVLLAIVGYHLARG